MCIDMGDMHLKDYILKVNRISKMNWEVLNMQQEILHVLSNGKQSSFLIIQESRRGED